MMRLFIVALSCECSRGKVRETSGDVADTNGTQHPTFFPKADIRFTYILAQCTQHSSYHNAGVSLLDLEACGRLIRRIWLEEGSHRRCST